MSNVTITRHYAASFVALREMQPRMRHRQIVPIEAQTEEEAIGKAWIWARNDAPTEEGWNIADVLVVPIKMIFADDADEKEGKMSKIVPTNPIECECTDCPWQGRWADTDAGVCPDCGAECVETSEAEAETEGS